MQTKITENTDPFLANYLFTPKKGVHIKAVTPKKGVPIKAVTPKKGVPIKAVTPKKGSTY